MSPAELVLTVKVAFDLILSKHGTACMPFLHAISTVKNSGIDALKLAMAEVYSHRYSDSPVVSIADETPLEE